MYRIEWQSKITGLSGRGEALFATEETAQKYADALNRKYPYIQHCVVKVQV